MLPSNKTKGPRACSTCAKAKSRCVPGNQPNICERCERLGKPCSSQLPATARRQRLQGQAADAGAASEPSSLDAASSSFASDILSDAQAAARARGAKPTRVAELERRLEDLTTRLESVSRQQQQGQTQQRQSLDGQPESVPGTEPTGMAPAMAFPQPRAMPYYPMTHLFRENGIPIQPAMPSRSSPASSSNSNGSSSGSGGGSKNQGNRGSQSSGSTAHDPEPDCLPAFNQFPAMPSRRPQTPPLAPFPLITRTPCYGKGTSSSSVLPATERSEIATPASLPWPWPQRNEAEMLLREFRSHVMPLMPFVQVPQTVFASQLLETRPLTWKSVMMVACHLDGPRQVKMGHLLLSELSTAAIVQPKRSIDLLHAIQLLVAWYHYNVSSFQLNNLFFLMRGICISLGLSDPPPSATAMGLDRAMQRKFSPTELEGMRSFLGTFYLVSYSTTNKKSDMLMNTPYLEACCKVLERQQEHPSDFYLVQLVRVQQLSQSIMAAYALRTAGIQTGLSIHGLIDNFEKQITYLVSQLPRHFRDDATLVSHIRIAEILLYEVALQDNTGPGDTPELTAAERLSLLSRCLRATRAYMDNRFSTPILEQPRFICLASYDFLFAFLTALKLITVQMPGWDPRKARRDVDFDQVIDRKIYDMQRLADRRMLRAQAPRVGVNTDGSDDYGDGSTAREGPIDPFERLVMRLRELKAMISRELDALPETPAPAAAAASPAAMPMDRDGVDFHFAESSGSGIPSLSRSSVDSTPAGGSHSTTAKDADVAMTAADDAEDTRNVVEMTDANFDFGMIDAAQAIFNYADATMVFMQDGMNHMVMPDMTEMSGISMATPPYIEPWNHVG